MKIVLAFVCIFALGQPRMVKSLSCYHCTVSLQEEGQAQDLTCVKEPWNVTGSVRTCMPYHKACRIIRIEYKESGTIQSFERACSVPGEDGMEESSNIVIYQRHCYTSLCNKGSGLLDDTDNSGKRIVAILVPDAKDIAQISVISPAAIIVVLLNFIFGRRYQ